ncbi:translation initiation factor eIF3 subunit [Myriangium duriaei CBS 260.36]|uniref:Eukaryotic translation initiation factor 3 subunit J n=1 Tax=Myriangium duriaei CBS 260.36 TaxID=1168546 RepID=A0A9P4JAK6_9PEZI|nr:translation initiation factor eIF3 subunit [Myriangium duriaei CBS 260.36]
MAPNAWDDEESGSSSPNSPVVAAVRRGKFDDEEDDSDVLESWDAAEDSEVEREKAKKAAEAKAKAEAEAKANHKTKSQRIEERRQENMRRRLADEESSDEDEDEADKRARLRKTEKDSDLKHAEDLFGSIGISNNRGAVKPVTIQSATDPNQTFDLASLPLWNPSNKEGFTQLRETLVPLLGQNARKAQYTIFLQEFVKQISKELPSDQIKKVSSALTALSNEKMKEEKAAEKGGKKTKAAKTKVSLSAARDVSAKADTTAYDDGLEDDDFM